MQSVSSNLRTLLWSFLLALAIWVTAVTAADPDEVRVFPFRVPIEVIGQDPGLVISTEYPSSVDVTLRAPHSVWERLSANAQSVRAILDLSGLSAGEHTLALQIQVSERPVRIVSASPESITLTLEPLITRTLPVDLSLAGQPAIGYQAGDAHLEPGQVIVAGAQSKVQKVARARVIVSLDGIRESVEKAVPVELLDVAGQPISGLSISPQTVFVNLPISQQGGYRDLAVKVVVRGQVAHGYRLDNISVFPPVITVYSSDPALVSALPGVVETHPLDLQNVSDDITTRLELNLPAGVSVVGERTVLVQVGISPIESSLTLSNKEVEIVGLPAGLLPLISPSTVDVIVSGPLPLLDTLTRQDVRVYVDVTGLSAGTYQLTPKVEVLISDIRVESILPGTIEVTLLVPATFTPSP
jgi:YbbR domain-containing protein